MLVSSTINNDGVVIEKHILQKGGLVMPFSFSYCFSPSINRYNCTVRAIVDNSNMLHLPYSGKNEQYLRHEKIQEAGLLSPADGGIVMTWDVCIYGWSAELGIPSFEMFVDGRYIEPSKEKGFDPCYTYSKVYLPDDGGEGIIKQEAQSFYYHHTDKIFSGYPSKISCPFLDEGSTCYGDSGGGHDFDPLLTLRGQVEDGPTDLVGMWEQLEYSRLNWLYNQLVEED